MKLPAEARLVGAAAGDVKLPKTLRVTKDAPDLVLVLRAASREEAANEVPAPDAKSAGSAIFIFPDEARAAGFLGRFRPKKEISRATRATVLLLRGYVDIGAAEIDGVDWVYAKAPT